MGGQRPHQTKADDNNGQWAAGTHIPISCSEQKEKVKLVLQNIKQSNKLLTDMGIYSHDVPENIVT